MREGFLARFLKAPDFTHFQTDSAVTITFSLLIRAIILFAVMLCCWSVGASVMRAAWLLGLPELAQSRETIGAVGWGIIYDPVFVLFQIIRGLGGIAVICMAGGLIGAMLGFVFGIPRPVSAAEAPPAGAGGTPVPAGLSRRKVWDSSTNLTQISDWLTKIIVGVGLVEGERVWAGFSAIAGGAAAWLFASRHGSPTIIGAALVGSVVLGFLFCYLYTDLIIARLIAATDTSLGVLVDEKSIVAIGAIGNDQEVLGPRISRLQQLGERPSAELVAAALKVSMVSVKDLTTPRDIRMWARARAVLNDYDSAADAYIRLLGMEDDRDVSGDAGLLLEAGRVIYAARRTNEAAALVELALEAVDSRPDLREAIIGDAAVLRLAGITPGGYEDTLRLLEPLTPKPGDAAPALPDSTGRLHLLRALANGQKYKATIRDGAAASPQAIDFQNRVLEDLKFALDKKIIAKRSIREFWDPAALAPLASGWPHDDLTVFFHVQKFKELLAD